MRDGVLKRERHRLQFLRGRLYGVGLEEAAGTVAHPLDVDGIGGVHGHGCSPRERALATATAALRASVPVTGWRSSGRASHSRPPPIGRTWTYGPSKPMTLPTLLLQGSSPVSPRVGLYPCICPWTPVPTQPHGGPV